MTNYIFLLGLYLILTVLTFAYPKALQKRNHIVNGILMGFLLVFTEAILIPNGFELSVPAIIDLVTSALPEREDPADTLKFIEQLKENFISSIITPVIFFIIGVIAYFFKKISINTFDTLFTGLFAFVIYFDFVLFSVTGLFWHYILFFIAYAIFSFGRIQLFMFFGIKSILDDRSISNN